MFAAAVGKVANANVGGAAYLCVHLAGSVPDAVEAQLCFASEACRFSRFGESAAARGLKPGENAIRTSAGLPEERSETERARRAREVASKPFEFVVVVARRSGVSASRFFGVYPRPVPRNSSKFNASPSAHCGMPHGTSDESASPRQQAADRSKPEPTRGELGGTRLRRASRVAQWLSPLHSKRTGCPRRICQRVHVRSPTPCSLVCRPSFDRAYVLVSYTHFILGSTLSDCLVVRAVNLYPLHDRRALLVDPLGVARLRADFAGRRHA